ncbi:hypothetical protein M422DRAFT_41017 [Sphaerobolus stellatus SS14]|nr:hypothetical protein M422DRAFT_41017 [Sphaerobolus stellatus SS14]
MIEKRTKVLNGNSLRYDVAGSDFEIIMGRASREDVCEGTESGALATNAEEPLSLFEIIICHKDLRARNKLVPVNEESEDRLIHSARLKLLRGVTHWRKLKAHFPKLEELSRSSDASEISENEMLGLPSFEDQEGRSDK